MGPALAGWASSTQRWYRSRGDIIAQSLSLRVGLEDTGLRGSGSVCQSPSELDSDSFRSARE